MGGHTAYNKPLLNVSYDRRNKDVVVEHSSPGSSPQQITIYRSGTAPDKFAHYLCGAIIREGWLYGNPTLGSLSGFPLGDQTAIARTLASKGAALSSELERIVERPTPINSMYAALGTR